MNKRELGIFIGGLLTGAVAGIGGTLAVFKRKETKAADQYETIKSGKTISGVVKKSLMEEFDDIADIYRRKDHNEKTPEEGEVARPGGRMSPEERQRTKEMLQRNYEQTTNYAKMYKISSEDPAESEYPEDDEERHDPTCETEENQNEIKYRCRTCDSWKDGFCILIQEHVNKDDWCEDWDPVTIDQDIETPEEEAFDEHRKNMNKPPRIISAEDYANLPSYIDQEVLYYYAYDEMLCDENEEPVDEPSDLIGDALEKYGFADSDERLIFVMNYATDTCYEIQKLDQSWTETH